MSSKNVVFEDTLNVSSIDREGKFFSKTSRIEGITSSNQCKVQLDINVEVYPIESKGIYSLMIVRSLNPDGTPSGFNYSQDLLYKEGNLLSRCDYAMHGKVFKYTEEGDNFVTIYISYGGLMMGITGDYSHLSSFNLDDKVFLLITKLE